MEHVEQRPVWDRLIVAGLIFAGIGLTGTSMVTRVKVIEEYPSSAYFHVTPAAFYSSNEPHNLLPIQSIGRVAVSR
jgi:hypothetical protein